MANYFHAEAKISPLASIELSSRGTDTRIGAMSAVDDFVKIKHVGGAGHVVLGERVFVNSGTVIYSGNGVSIGSDVLIGPNCNLVAVNHAFADAAQTIAAQKFMPSRGGITIGDDVWLGAGVTVCDGARIGTGAVIGAHSLVTGPIPEYAICYGTPARVMRYREGKKETA